MLASPHYSPAAMENWGLVIYHENYLIYDSHTNSSFNKRKIASVIAHEIAHMVNYAFHTFPFLSSIVIFVLVVWKFSHHALVGRFMAERRIRYVYGIYLWNRLCHQRGISHGISIDKYMIELFQHIKILFNVQCAYRKISFSPVPLSLQWFTIRRLLLIHSPYKWAELWIWRKSLTAFLIERLSFSI